MIKTPFSEAAKLEIPLSEYPHPQLVREDAWLCLNGKWQYAITRENEPPRHFDGEIIVPFSPECELSGVKRILLPDEYLWYERTFELPDDFLRDGHLLLHFGAIDQRAAVFVNGKPVGCHSGGYTAFSFDITKQKTKLLTISVCVRDESDTSFHSRGKQKLNRGGIWYTPQSGIWQTVWLEHTPPQYLSSLRITPLFDEKEVELTALSDSEGECRFTVCGEVAVSPVNVPVRIRVPSALPWSPEEPHLYDICAEFGKDRVQSYFGLRKYSVEKDARGVARLCLNGKPYFHTGVLDQGYYSDGLYTPASDEAMIADIVCMKQLGFNLLRKHIKIEPLRFYYHCDKLGMLVWQDMPNGGETYHPLLNKAPLATGIHLRDNHYRLFARQSKQGREEYRTELAEMIKQLYNAVSIAVWVPFNEGWGQFDAKAATKLIYSLDRTRTVDHASGWHDQKCGELQSLHCYFKPYRFRFDRHHRAVVLSEFGGYNLAETGHVFSENGFGYKGFSDKESLMQAIEALYRKQIIPAAKKGLSASVYTQLSDVEDELNGFLTYDRQVLKVDASRIAALNAECKDAVK